MGPSAPYGALPTGEPFSCAWDASSDNAVGSFLEHPYGAVTSASSFASDSKVYIVDSVNSCQRHVSDSGSCATASSKGDLYRLLLFGNDSGAAIGRPRHAARPRSLEQEELDRKVEVEVQRARVLERWGRLSCGVRVRGVIALASREVIRREEAQERVQEGAHDEAHEEAQEEVREEAQEEDIGTTPPADGGAAEDAQADAEAMKYAGLFKLTDGERAGELLDKFEEAQTCLELINVADVTAMATLLGKLAEAATFTLCSGHADAQPSEMPIVGSAAVIEYLKQTEVPRTKGCVASVQPAALLLDGRTAVSFDLKSKAPGEPSSRFQDVLKWDSSGMLCQWTRVFEPRPTQREWLQLISAGKLTRSGALVSNSFGFLMAEGGASPRAKRSAERCCGTAHSRW